MSAIITSADSLKSLPIIRSLGKKGIYITTADSRSNALGAASKYSKSFFQYPSPAQTPLEFINALQKYLKKHQQEVLIPIHSQDTYIIAEYRQALQQFAKIPVHDYSIIKRVNDKGKLMLAAEQLGILIPQTYQPGDINEVHHIADIIDYPAVIKLRNTSSSIGLSYAYCKEELISKFKKTIEKFRLPQTDYPLIQEYIEGDGCGVSVLFNDGDLRAKFTHKRLREYPISGGPSTYRVSIRDPKSEDAAIKLLKHFDWHGVAMVEFKLTKDNKPVLMEINPRFWGSINQAIQSGVDFPYLLYTMASEGDVERVLNYKVGVKTKNLLTDYVALMSYIKKTKNIRLLKEFAALPHNDDIISLDDPVPLFRFIRRGIHEVCHPRQDKLKFCNNLSPALE